MKLLVLVLILSGCIAMEKTIEPATISLQDNMEYNNVKITLVEKAIKRLIEGGEELHVSLKLQKGEKLAVVNMVNQEDSSWDIYKFIAYPEELKIEALKPGMDFSIEKGNYAIVNGLKITLNDVELSGGQEKNSTITLNKLFFSKKLQAIAGDTISWHGYKITVLDLGYGRMRLKII